MKKTRGIIAVLLLALALTLAAGCGKEPAKLDLDIAALSADVIASGAYTDSMGQTKAETATTIYKMDGEKVSQCSVYFSSMATAEECAIFKAADAKSVETLVAACKARQEAQVSAYENYVPTEVEKIENAIIGSADDYVFYIVSADNAKVTEVLTSYGVEIK